MKKGSLPSWLAYSIELLLQSDVSTEGWLESFISTRH